MPLRNFLQLSGPRLQRLASATGIEAERLNSIASSNRASAWEVSRIAAALGIGVADLVRPDPTPQQAEFRFRAAAAQSSASDRVNPRTIDQVAARIDGIQEILTHARQEARSWAAPRELRQDPFALAAWFRSSCFNGDQFSPLLQLAQILDQCLGVVVVVLKRTDVDGLCAVVGGTPYIFIRAQYKPRMLFTLAHELGHLLAHASNGDYASLDPLGSVSRRPQHRSEEGFANSFASELLMPLTGVGAALKEIRDAFGVDGPLGDIEILLVSNIFGVSFEVAARRCEGLGLLPTGGATSLVEFVTRTYGSPEKRASEIGLPARPDVTFPIVSASVLQSASRAIFAGAISIGRVLDRLRVDMNVLLEENTALGHGFSH